MMKRKYAVFAENLENRTLYLCDEPVFSGDVQLMHETDDYEEAEKEARYWERSLSSSWKVTIY
jgi:hypothetical protein